MNRLKLFFLTLLALLAIVPRASAATQDPTAAAKAQADAILQPPSANPASSSTIPAPTPTPTSSVSGAISQTQADVEACVKDLSKCSATKDAASAGQAQIKACTDNPIACAQNPQQALASLNAMQTLATDGANRFFNQQVAAWQSAAIKQVTDWANPILQKALSGVAGWFGGGSTSPSNKAISANNSTNTTAVATQALANDAAAKIIATQNAANGNYQFGAVDAATNQASQAIAASVVGSNGIQQINAVAAASTQNVNDADSQANTQNDSSLDAIASSNRILAKIVSQNDLLLGAANDRKIIEAQNLRQNATIQQAIAYQNKLRDLELERTSKTSVELQRQILDVATT
ncbi:hypothetical protein, partial [Chamaesiphon polymorphus]